MITRAYKIAIEDNQLLSELSKTGKRYFELSNKPVIRWIKGEGLDDEVTRSAIGHATRLFGSDVDYCLCTNIISSERARYVLELATQPVEWIKLTPSLNETLALHLYNAGCAVENFGYWWKWFPSRVRLNASEWILDGDMIIVKQPAWYDLWKTNTDVLRVSQDNKSVIQPNGHYGDYYEGIDKDLMLYSGIISLPPGIDYVENMNNILSIRPLSFPHNGRISMDEQGVIAQTFQAFNPVPIPLYEFPFGRAFEDQLDYGIEGDKGKAWAYHFGNSFKTHNKHYDTLVNNGVIWTEKNVSIENKYRWMGNYGQWGIPGWSMSNDNTKLILDRVKKYKGKSVLELGTSRGRMTAMLHEMGCNVTTIDKYDRGAKENLSDLSINIIIEDAITYLTTSNNTFDCIIADIHDNSEAIWQKLWPVLQTKIKSDGEAILSNALLYKVSGWEEEVGIKWVINNLEDSFYYQLDDRAVPGIAIIKPI